MQGRASHISSHLTRCTLFSDLSLPLTLPGAGHVSTIYSRGNVGSCVDMAGIIRASLYIPRNNTKLHVNYCAYGQRLGTQRDRDDTLAASLQPSKSYSPCQDSPYSRLAAYEHLGRFRWQKAMGPGRQFDAIAGLPWISEHLH